MKQINKNRIDRNQILYRLRAIINKNIKGGPKENLTKPRGFLEQPSPCIFLNGKRNDSRVPASKQF